MADETIKNEEQATEPMSSEEEHQVDETMAEEVKEALEHGDFDIGEFLNQYKEALSVKEEAEGRAMRVQADFDNFRRRSRKDNEDAGIRANGDLIYTLLPIIDNFERALEHMSESDDKDGVSMIYNQLCSLLAEAGLKEIEAKGADFDPNIHQAVVQEPVDDAQKGKVLQVLQKGYMYGDRLIRPAMVQVGS